jgi:hypothetical protein
MSKLPPFGLFPTPIRLSAALVPAGSGSGAIVGQLSASVGALTLSVVSGPFTINGSGQLVTSSVTGSAGSIQTVRVRAARASPFLQIDQDFVVTAGAVLSALSLASGAAQVGVSGSDTITGTSVGSTLALTDTVGGKYSLVGTTLSWTSAVTAGTDRPVVVETLAGAAGSPRQTTLAVVVTAILPGQLNFSDPSQSAWESVI